MRKICAGRRESRRASVSCPARAEPKGKRDDCAACNDQHRKGVQVIGGNHDISGTPATVNPSHGCWRSRPLGGLDE
jgi:hypothetical protein